MIAAADARHDAGSRQGGRLALDADPEVDHGEHVVLAADGRRLEGERRRFGYGEDERPAALERLHETLGLEPRHRLPRHGAGDGVLLDQLGLGRQLRAGSEVAAEDLVLEPGDDVLGAGLHGRDHALKVAVSSVCSAHLVRQREAQAGALRHEDAAVADLDPLLEQRVQPLEVLDPRLGRVGRGEVQVDLHRVVRRQREPVVGGDRREPEERA